MNRRRSDSTQFPALPGSLAALRGFLACCEGSKECGKVCASGVYEKGTVKSTKFMSAACKLGAAKLPRKANVRTCA